MALTSITTAFPTGGSGTITITDTTAAAVDLLTAQTLALTTAVSTTMGFAGSKTPGNVSSSMALQASMQANIVKALGAIEANQQTMITALHNISASIETNTKAVAAVASATSDIAIMATTATADQVRNNKFQQTVTNQALKDAGKPPVEIKDDELKEVLTQTLTDMKSMSTVQFTYKAVDKAQEMLTNSAKWTLQWASETKVAKFFVDAYTSAKKSVLALFPKETANSAVRDNKATIVEIESGTFT
jgi:hypothetical protein